MVRTQPIGPEKQKPVKGRPKKSLPQRVQELEETRDKHGEDIRKLDLELRLLRTDSYQAVSMFVGILGIILTIIIAAAFQTNKLVNPNLAIEGLLFLIAGLLGGWLVFFIVYRRK